MIYFLLRWINTLTTKRLQKMNRKKEMKKIINIIKNDQDMYEKILSIINQEKPLEKEEENINQGGFVIKEIKFDEYLNKEEFINLVNSQTMGKRRFKN